MIIHSNYLMMRDNNKCFTLHHIDPGSQIKRSIAHGQYLPKHIIEEAGKSSNRMSDLERSDLADLDKFCADSNYIWEFILKEYEKLKA